MSSGKEYRISEYKKRPGMYGNFIDAYEINLLSLLYFRAMHDENIEEFLLASNVDNVGSFDDICFTAKVRGHDKPVAVFIQAQQRLHKTLQIDCAKYFNSYLKIRQRFDNHSRIKDPFFRGTFDETECLFVIYTNAKVEILTQSSYTYPKSGLSDELNKLLDTGGMVKQVDNDVNMEYLTKTAVKDQITALAQCIARFINDDRHFERMLLDELVLRYHVVLAQKVVDVSEIQPLASTYAPRYRIASFRQDFFDNNDEYIMLFRDTLYLEIIKLQRNDKIDGFPSIVNKTVAMEILSSLKFKVPITFGNKDLKLSGSDDRIERRIRYLTYRITCWIRKFECSKVVTIDESLELGFQQYIANAIGNIFVLDDNTKLMKITDNCETLEPLAKRLYTNLNSEIQNLHEYKFSIKVNNLPKLSFDSDYYEENLARDFLNKLLFYSKQGGRREVEEILKYEIEAIQCNQPISFQVQTAAIFSRYCDEIEKWYLISGPVSPYLTKNPNLFRQAIDTIIKDPQMSSINLMYYRSKIQQHDYTFTEDAVRFLNLLDKCSSTIIVAENCVLTVVKLLQHLKNKKQEQHVVLDLEYIASLPTDDLNALCKEFNFLRYTIVKKVLILVCDKIESSDKIQILEKIASVLQNITIIIVTKQNSLEILNEYFPQAENILHDKKSNLIDMCEESQKSIFETASAAFPGVEIRLDHLLRGWPKTDLKSTDAAAVADKGTVTGSRGVEYEE